MIATEYILKPDSSKAYGVYDIDFGPLYQAAAVPDSSSGAQVCM